TKRNRPDEIRLHALATSHRAGCDEKPIRFGRPYISEVPSFEARVIKVLAIGPGKSPYMAGHERRRFHERQLDLRVAQSGVYAGRRSKLHLRALQAVVLPNTLIQTSG